MRKTLWKMSQWMKSIASAEPIVKNRQNLLSGIAPKSKSKPVIVTKEKPINPSIGLGNPNALACGVNITGPQLMIGLILQGNSVAGFSKSSILSSVNMKEVSIPTSPPISKMYA
jgi:hypothetical protein